MTIFGEQQQQVLDGIKCPIKRQIMADLMQRAKDAPAGGRGSVGPPPRKGRKRQR